MGNRAFVVMEVLLYLAWVMATVVAWVFTQYLWQVPVDLALTGAGLWWGIKVFPDLKEMWVK